jgi:hypothetical protein
MAVKEKRIGEAATAGERKTASKAAASGLVCLTIDRSKKLRTTGGPSILKNEFDLPTVVCVPAGDVDKWPGWTESKGKVPGDLVEITKAYTKKSTVIEVINKRDVTKLVPNETFNNPEVAHVPSVDLPKWKKRNWKAA